MLVSDPQALKLYLVSKATVAVTTVPSGFVNDNISPEGVGEPADSKKTSDSIVDDIVNSDDTNPDAN